MKLFLLTWDDSLLQTLIVGREKEKNKEKEAKVKKQFGRHNALGFLL